jgi:hypothetical protein
MDQVKTFLAEGILVDAPEDTDYADWWAAARSDSFRPAIDLRHARTGTRSAGA